MKNKLHITCGDCGEKLEVDEIPKHKCKIWRSLLFKKDYTILGMTIFLISILLIADTNLNSWIKFSLGFLVGLLSGLFEIFLEKLIKLINLKSH
jgi:energy-converting hydrogenase Eha subunit A